jgi:tripartite-type tricarboxylate transporter receptor subunit TctC
VRGVDPGAAETGKMLGGTATMLRKLRKPAVAAIAMIGRILPVVLAGVMARLALPVAAADPVADFYRGKVITLYVGFPPGGGYDLYARVLAPHFTRHIPGNPPIVIKSLLGGSGIKAAGYMTGITPQDGTSLGMFLDALTLGKVLGGPGEFDPVKLVWIGRIVSTATVSVVWHTSPVQTIEEAKHRELLMAGTVASNTSNFIPAALNDLIGTKIRVIMGFRGSPDQALAMMRGETNAIGGMSWEAIQTNHQDWLTEKKIRVLYAQGAHRIPDLPNDPGLLDLAVDERSRQVLGLLGGVSDVGRTIVAEPNIPPERAKALRDAFMATMQDPQFIAEMKARHLNIEPLSGQEVQKMVASFVATPRELVDQAKRYIGQ